MKRNWVKVLLAASVFVSFILTMVQAAPVRADDSQQTYVVVLDPGHGGVDGGASETFGGVEYYESDINLQIAKYCYRALKKEPNLKVYMTRSKDVYVGVTERVVIADQKSADLLVSLHINSAGDISYSASGCMVLLSQGTYRPYLAKKEEVFTDLVLKNLNAIGIKTSASSEDGRYYRLSDNSSRYPNGKISDYYGIVASSVERDFPGVIIEHCFITNPSDCSRFLSSKAKLKRIGEADAKAIVSYFKSEAADPGFGKEENQKPEWVRIGGKYYYRKADGSFAKNQWLKLDGKRYYVKADGTRAERFCRISGHYYFFRPEGFAATGRYKVGESYYLFTGTGKMIARGWYTSSKGRHYYTYPIKHKKKGRLLVGGEYIISGKVYRFNALGVCTNYKTAREATASQTTSLETVA